MPPQFRIKDLRNLVLFAAVVAFLMRDEPLVGIVFGGAIAAFKVSEIAAERVARARAGRGGKELTDAEVRRAKVVGVLVGGLVCYLALWALTFFL